MSKLLLAICLLCTAHIAFSQKDKFGKLKRSDFAVDVRHIDEEADAFYIFDHGISEIRYTGSEFKLFHDRHFRIKILNPDGFDQANFLITQYRNKYGRDRVSNLKVETFWLEDGKVQSQRMEKDQIFEEDWSEYVFNTRFAAPAIRKDCIVEVKYKLASDFLTLLRDWQFQYEIPVLESTYTTVIPEYFKYQTSMKGGISPTHVEDETTYTTWSTQTGHSEGDIKVTNTSTTYTFRNVEAVKNENMISSIWNYIGTIEFSLSGIEFPFGQTKDYSSSWEKVNESIFKNSHYSKVIQKYQPLKDESARIAAGCQNCKEKAAKLLDHIQSNYEWNLQFSVYPSQPLSKTQKTKRGNNADLNLLLLGMLKSVSCSVYPVVSRARKYGFIFPNRSSLASLNYVFPVLQYEDKWYPMDATTSELPIGLLPDHSLNRFGWLVDEKIGQWFDIVPTTGLSNSCQFTLNLDADMKLNGTAKVILKGYGAYAFKTRQADKQMDEMLPLNEGIITSNIEVEKPDGLDKTVNVLCEVDASSNVQEAGDLILINPFPMALFEENPFVSDERKYPVDFQYSRRTQIMTQLQIDSAFAVDELPEKAVVQLPENAGRFTYHVQQLNDKIIIVGSLSITETIIPTVDYASLKALFDMVEQKLQEPIILKRS